MIERSHTKDYAVWRAFETEMDKLAYKWTQLWRKSWSPEYREATDSQNWSVTLDTSPSLVIEDNPWLMHEEEQETLAIKQDQHK